MTYVAPNSVQARDIASLVHPQTNLATHLEEGPVVISRGQGIYVWDDSGQQFLDGAAGLWCASLGFASERLARVAYEQMRTLGYSAIRRRRFSSVPPGSPAWKPILIDFFSVGDNPIMPLLFRVPENYIPSLDRR